MNSRTSLFSSTTLSLIPCSNGMKIESLPFHGMEQMVRSLNPCCNGMKIESEFRKCHKVRLRVLILVVME